MSDRLYNQFGAWRLERGVVVVHAHVSIGATGAVTFQAWNPNNRTYSTAGSSGWGGVKSVTRTGTGLYTFVLNDKFQRLLAINWMENVAGGTANIVSVQNNTTTTDATTGTIAICTMSSTATAADPDSGCTMDFEFVLQNSSAG